MENRTIQFDEGYIEFSINNDPERILKINPSDLSLLERMQEAIKTLKKQTETVKNIKITTNGNAVDNLSEAAETVCKANKMLRSTVDHVFYDGAADIIFKNQNPLALTADGKTIFESFFSGFNKAVKPILAAQAKKSNAHLEKYRDEYSALKKSLEKNARKAS